MNTFYLIRHGQDYDNAAGILNGHRDRTLTEIGINQAIELARKINQLNLPVDAVIASPLNRAFVTASIVSGLNAYPTPQVEPLLIERNFGIMTGKKQSDIIPMCSPDILQAEKVTYFLNPPDAETFPDLLSRANQLLEKLNTQFHDQKIILASHGDFGKMLFAAYYQLDWQKVLTAFHFGNSELLILSPDTNPDQAKLISIEQHNI